MTFDIARSSEIIVAGRGGRCVHVAVQELAAARADAVEDRRVPDALPLEIQADATENFLLGHPRILLANPLVALLLP